MEKLISFAEKVIAFNRRLDYKGNLPRGIRVMNPFIESTEALRISELFYNKYYNDNNTRHIILGINPGRFGAGITGIPFTDTIRLKEICNISAHGLSSYETSSVFIYDLIREYGGAEGFYNQFYINSVCPLGFVKRNSSGREVNYNYYDDRELTGNLSDFIIETLKEQFSFGIRRDVVFCLGSGKNYQFLNKLNGEINLFDRLIPLEHPRYIMQYRLKRKEEYIKSFIKLLND